MTAPALQTDAGEGEHRPPMNSNETKVFVVDDESVRRGFSRLMRSAGFEPRVYDSAERFLRDHLGADSRA